MDPEIILRLLALIAALSIHEFSHALAAEYLGDPTAKLKNRLTLNPIAHLDPIGTLMFVITLFGTGVIFGWGKPVPVDPYNLKNPKKDMALIALAGPASNLITAILVAILFRVVGILNIDIISQTLIPFFSTFMSLSIFLAVFNLFPVPPLDGSKILYGILPSKQAQITALFLNQYGTFILIAALFTGVITYFTYPIATILLQILIAIAG